MADRSVAGSQQTTRVLTNPSRSDHARTCQPLEALPPLQQSPKRVPPPPPPPREAQAVPPVPLPLPSLPPLSTVPHGTAPPPTPLDAQVRRTAPMRGPRVLPERPLLHVLAGSGDSGQLVELFTRRGFAAGALTTAEDLETLTGAGHLPAAVIIDLQRVDAHRAIDGLQRLASAPVIVGIVEPCKLTSPPFQLDAAFLRPVDPARLFVSVVELLADRKKGKGRGQKRITGIVAMVDGNELFRAVTRELHAIMSPVCAGAVLELALRELSVSTYAVSAPDLDAILASGRLAAALKAYASVGAICATVGRIRALVHA